MRVHSFTVGETQVSMRLTAEKLESYCRDYGDMSTNPIVALLEASDNIAARAALFTRALQYPGNTNTIKSGHALMDELADAGYTPEDIHDLILRLARDCGQLSEADLEDLKTALKTNNDRLLQVITDSLTGKLTPGVNIDTAAAQTENPT